MIYTLTLNPAIDLYIETNKMDPFVVNRTNESDVIANGKGINVSFILKKMKINSIALGIGGGFTNQFIEDELDKEKIRSKFIHVEGMTRINVFTNVIRNNQEFKLVNKGPKVSKKKFNELMLILKQLKPEDMLIVSGSFAKGIEPKQIIKIAELSNENKFSLVLDTNYQEVMDTLKYKPFLLKPNDEELKKWFKISDDEKLTKKEFKNYCMKLIKMGAQNVLLSMGSKGAMFVDEKNAYFGNSAVGKVVNTACAGDTMLGTFIGCINQNYSIKESLHKSIAAASSTAFTSGLTDFSDVNKLMEQIEIRELED